MTSLNAMRQFPSSLEGYTAMGFGLDSESSSDAVDLCRIANSGYCDASSGWIVDAYGMEYPDGLRFGPSEWLRSMTDPLSMSDTYSQVEDELPNLQSKIQELIDSAEDAQNDDSYDIVYRNPGHGQHPSAVIFGFFAKAPDNMTRGLAFHVRKGSSYPTRFISLTRSLQVAKAKQSPDPIYVINLNEAIGVVYDLTVPSVLNEHIKNPITQNYATASQEVVVEGWIPPTAIKGLIL
jgi:hypothetical protein